MSRAKDPPNWTGLSRQRKWQLRKRLRGLCEKCGRRKISDYSTVHCRTCMETDRTRYWERMGIDKPREKKREPIPGNLAKSKEKALQGAPVEDQVS